MSLIDIETNPVFVPVNLSDAGTATVQPLAVSNMHGEGAVIGEAHIATASGWRSPSADAYVHQAFPSNTYAADDHLELKLEGTHGRESYLTFDVSALPEDAKTFVVRTFFYEIIYPDNKKIRESHWVEIAGNTSTYSGLRWSTRPVASAMIPIDTVAISYDELGSYIAWDVTDWLKACRRNGVNAVTFRLKIVSQGSGLLDFHSLESTVGDLPQLLVEQTTVTGLKMISKDDTAAGTFAFFGIDGRLFRNDSPLQTIPGIYLKWTGRGMEKLRIKN
jgi:hypothetical protein